MENENRRRREQAKESRAYAEGGGEFEGVGGGERDGWSRKGEVDKKCWDILRNSRGGFTGTNAAEKKGEKKIPRGGRAIKGKKH